VSPATARPAGRPRNPELDGAILAAAEQQLREAGYAGMSLESVAAAAGTTVPAVRRRFGSKASLAVAVIDSLRVENLPAGSGPPRDRALAVLRNLHANLRRRNSMAVAGTLLAEEHRHPELLAAFRQRLVEPRREALRAALAEGISRGELPDSADPDVLASMLVGAFYARYIATSELPDDWAEQALRHAWPHARLQSGHDRAPKWLLPYTAGLLQASANWADSRKVWSMKQLRSTGARAALVGLLAAGTVAAGAVTASASTGFASCSAQGDYATCVAGGTAQHPVTITVSVTASPDQEVLVAWDAVCAQGSGAGSSSGSFTAQTPVSRVISHPYQQPDSCTVAADAQLQNGGYSISVSLSSSQSAPVASDQITGYAGKCVDDNGNSSAPRSKVQLWTCSGSAAQQWSFSGGELRHAGMCMTEKGTRGSGSAVILWPCTGARNQIWSHNAAGEYTLKANGLCLDDPSYSTRNGTQLDIYRCTGKSNQRWTLP
jgi:AcrR family transcriptional regulator